MYRHRASSCIGVILSQKRIVSWSEESLTAACGNASHEDEHQYSGRESCKHCSHTPEEDGDSHYPLAAETVSCETSERNHERIAKIEDGRNQTHRRVCKVERITDCRKNRIEHLTVRLIEQVCHPEEGKDFPFIVLMSTFHSGFDYVWCSVVQRYAKYLKTIKFLHYFVQLLTK